MVSGVVTINQSGGVGDNDNENGSEGGSGGGDGGGGGGE